METGICKTCGKETEGYKCDVCGAESDTHVEDHGCGGEHCVAKCKDCAKAETQCACSA